MLITRGSSVRIGVGPPDLPKANLSFESSPKVAFSGRNFFEKNFGGVAQLGEHLICIQEVRGSIPLASTILEVLFFDNYIA